MSDRAAKWQQDFQRARAELARASADLNRWELLAGQTSAQRSDRAQQGAAIRGKVSELKVELSRLLREIEALCANKQQQPEATRKSLTQWRDELTQAISELDQVQRRSRGSGQPGAAAAQAAAAAGGGAPNAPVGPGAPSGDFQKLEDGAPPRRNGAELQPVSQREMFEQQQQMMRSFDEPLTALQGTVDNIGRAANLIRGEVNLQNRMLDNTNAEVDRVEARMGRVRTLMVRFSENNASSRRLICWVLILLAVLITLFVWVVGS